MGGRILQKAVKQGRGDEIFCQQFQNPTTTEKWSQQEVAPRVQKLCSHSGLLQNLAIHPKFVRPFFFLLYFVAFVKHFMLRKGPYMLKGGNFNLTRIFKSSCGNTFLTALLLKALFL